VQPRR